VGHDVAAVWDDLAATQKWTTGKYRAYLTRLLEDALIHNGRTPACSSEAHDG
jgi:hypothetical protein